MEVYVARQPVFNRSMEIFGYELLYRRSNNNFYEGTSDNQATADVINNAFLLMQFEELTGGTKAFINFTGELIEKRIPHLLPKETIVIEILETVEVTETIIEACRKLKDQGYTLALDDFIFEESRIDFLEVADIIKVEFNEVPHDVQKRYISRLGHRVKFLAEKIETQEEFQQAVTMGYELFQGYFFTKPIIIARRELKNLSPNLIRIISELSHHEPEFETITGFIERDIGLSYKMLKLANSVFYGSNQKYLSIREAVIRLGIDELKRWVYLLMLRDIRGAQNSELVKTCIIRAKLMELLAVEMGMGQRSYEFFLTGMFSSIDVLLNREMKDILEELSLAAEVSAALIGRHNDQRILLNIVLAHEKANWDKWDKIECQESAGNISKKRFMALYLEALSWTMEMDLNK